MTRGDIKEIVMNEYARALKAKSRGTAMVINAEGRLRRAKRAMLALDMEVPEDDY